MLYDCFLFYNEIDMLKYRLNLLKETVDCFVILEATHTFAGNPKELYFKKEDFLEYNILHVLIDDFPYLDHPTKDQVWKNEKYQRNCMSRIFNELQPDDYILINDVDEIPDPETLKTIKKENVLQIGQFQKDFYYYNLY